MGYKSSEFSQQRAGKGQLHSGANVLPLHSRNSAVICCVSPLSWTNITYCQTWMRKCPHITNHRGEQEETWDSFQVQFLSIRRERERKVPTKRKCCLDVSWGRWQQLPLSWREKSQRKSRNRKAGPSWKFVLFYESPSETKPIKTLMLPDPWLLGGCTSSPLPVMK